MKISYITTVDISTNSGVRKKIYGQIEAMRGSGLEVMLIAPKEFFVEKRHKEIQNGAGEGT